MADASPLPPPGDLDDPEELAAKLEALMQLNEQLAVENAAFMSFLQRNAKFSEAELEDEKRAKKSRKRGKAEKLVQITTEQKVEVATRELEALKSEIQKTEKRGEKTLERFKALLEEADTRIAEMKKEAYEFKRDVVVAAVNPRTGKVSAERVLKYMEDTLTEKSTAVKNFELKSKMLKSQIRKFKQQLNEKQGLGETLSRVDYDQLTIENKQFYEKIQERNEELKTLKQIAGNAMLMLNTFKTELQHLVSEADWLRSEIQSRGEFLEKTRDQTAQVEEERSQAERTHTALKEKIAATKVPAVLDYIDQKAKLHELEKQLRDLSRKIEIATMELTRTRALARLGKSRA